ncbi:hypothetical protein CFP56_013763 [Quercus suber]|uniref:Uncharacterized protein n=1 Tax=Quercus suber TaxID=58331 RepID=A0AAW0M403_QUESU
MEELLLSWNRIYFSLRISCNIGFPNGYIDFSLRTVI